MEVDVLIIGGGAAACRAAIEAKKLGVKVAIVDKGRFGSSGATAFHRIARISAYMAGISNTEPQTTPQDHYEDVLNAAQNMADEELVKLVATEAPERFREVEHWGMRFIVGEVGYQRSPTSFADRSTIVPTYEGESLLSVLVKKVVEQNIEVIEETMAIDLLINHGVCVGIIAINKEGTVFTLKAKSLIMATGGAGQLFMHNLNPLEMTGDGYAMGLRSGAVFTNMEFMQISFGIQENNKKMLLGHELWRLLPRIYNKNNEDFLESNLPEGISLKQCIAQRSNDFPFSVRSQAKWIDALVLKEIRKGNGTINSCVYLDFTDVVLQKRKELSRAYGTLDWLQKQGIDVKKQAIEIAPCHHAFNGGYVINNKAETSIPGLFAAGEVTGGAHGADRPSGHMFAVTQVLGAKAGYHAALRSKKTRWPGNCRKQVMKRIKEVEELLDTKGGSGVEIFKKEIQTVMWRNVLTVRNEEGLINVYKKLEEIGKNYLSNIKKDKDNPFAPIEVKNMIETGKLIVMFSLLRRESRGNHYREDYPVKDINQGNPRYLDISQLNLSSYKILPNIRKWKERISKIQ